MSEEIQKAKAVMESIKLEYIYLDYADDCTWINFASYFNTNLLTYLLNQLYSHEIKLDY